jgi:hypothetical protein
VFWLSYKKCNLAVFGVNRVVIDYLSSPLVISQSPSHNQAPSRLTPLPPRTRYPRTITTLPVGDLKIVNCRSVRGHASAYATRRTRPIEKNALQRRGACSGLLRRQMFRNIQQLVYTNLYEFWTDSMSTSERQLELHTTVQLYAIHLPLVVSHRSVRHI